MLQLFEILDDPSLNKLYIVTEIVKKGTLGEALAKRMLATEEVRRYFRDLISALEYCHDVAGVIHRDIKPENILIDQNDRVKLADFGVSYIMNDGCDEITTKAGSNFFFSPEACKGTKYKGRGSDVWAAGVTLYYMCMRVYPFISNNFPDLFYKIQYDEPDYPNTLHPLLDDLLKKVLNKNPEDRLTIR